MEESSAPFVTIGAAAGLVGAALFSAMWIVAVIVDGHWVLGEQTLSELGGDRPGAFFFNSGVIAEGVLALLFMLGLWHATKKGTVQKVGIVVLLIASCALILIGAFPITTGLPHGITSYAFFGLALIGTLLLIIPLWTDEAFGPKAGIVTLASVIVSLTFLLLTNVPLTEAVGVICLLLWSSIISILMLKKREPVTGI